MSRYCKHGIDPRNCYECNQEKTKSPSSAGSLDDLKSEFDRKLAAMSDDELIEAFAEIGCEVQIVKREND